MLRAVCGRSDRLFATRLESSGASLQAVPRQDAAQRRIVQAQVQIRRVAATDDEAQSIPPGKRMTRG